MQISRFFLVSGLAFVAVAHPVAAGDVKTWFKNQNWWIEQTQSEDHLNQFCNLHYSLWPPPAPSYPSFGLIGSTYSPVDFVYADDGITWDRSQPNQVSLQVDNYPAFQTPPASPTGPEHLLAFDYSQFPKTPATFLSELWYGGTLLLTSPSGIHEYPLAGAEQALTAMGACMKQISADAAAARQPAPAAPQTTPPAPQSTPAPTTSAMRPHTYN
jgi:hypothetical protein